MIKHRTRRKIGVIRAMLSHNTDSFLSSIRSLYQDDKTLLRRLEGWTGRLFCLRRVILSQMDLILSKANLLQRLHGLFRIQALSKDTHDIRKISRTHVSPLSPLKRVLPLLCRGSLPPVVITRRLNENLIRNTF